MLRPMKIFSGVLSKMLLYNQIVGFLIQVYLKQELMNQHGLWHADIDLRNMKDNLLVCHWA